MAIVSRVRVAWSGGAVPGGGLSTFYFDTPSPGFQADVKDFFAALSSYVPSGVTWSIPNTGEEINTATGDIGATWTDGVSAVVTGSNPTTTYAAGVGCRIAWDTLGRTNNRHVRGSTFIVPLTSAGYQADGTINEAVRTPFLAAASALLAAQVGSFGIWTRPTDEHAGAFNSVVGYNVPDKVSWLRTRKT